MQAINDRPEDRAARRRVTLAIVVGAVVGAIFGVPRYGPISVGNAGLMGLGVMLALGIYALVLALGPAGPAEEGPGPDADLTPPPRP
jgi:hypothetical protein